MATIRKAGNDTAAVERRATNGGDGFLPRDGTHLLDVQRGVVWSICGVTSEVAPLREVLLAWPGDELKFDDPPDRWLMLEKIDVKAIRKEAQAIEKYYTSNGVKVHRYEPPTAPPPNLIFMRDLFFMTKEGAILARMGAQQRAGEERFAAHALATIGVPILGVPRADATFEGADALWLDARTVLVGLGRRTNSSALRQLRPLLREIGADVQAIPMPRGVQHLLGMVNFVDRDLAVVYKDKAPPALQRVLTTRGVRVVELEKSDELVRGRAINFVTMAPRHIVMPAGCPNTKARLEAEGIRCDELRVDQYLRAAGGLGCLTGIIRREG